MRQPNLRVRFYAQRDYLQMKNNLSVFTRCSDSSLASLGAAMYYTGCKLPVDPLSSSSLLIGHTCKLFGAPGTDANDDYLFFLLCCMCVSFLAGQTHWIAQDNPASAIGMRIHHACQNLVRGDTPLTSRAHHSNEPHL